MANRVFHPDWAQMYPMPVTPYELYMLLDQHEHYPMTSVTCWFFRGAIHRELLQEAFDEAIRYEPAFWQRAARRGGHFSWTVDFSVPPPLRFRMVATNPSAAAMSGEGSIPVFDLEHGPGVDFLVEEGPDEVAIHFSMHHALADGGGMLQFMESWMAAYEKRLNPEGECEPVFPDPWQYPHRRELHLEFPEKVPWHKKISSAIYYTFQWANRRPWVLRGENKTPAAEIPSLPVYYWYRVDSELRDNYAAVGKKAGLSVNSLLLRDLYLTLRHWRERQEAEAGGASRKKRWFRILTPCNLRNAHHETMPCANMVGYSFFDCLPETCTRDQGFIDCIQRYIAHIKKWHTYVIFLAALGVLEKIPFMLRRITSSDHCHSTAVLSNLGVLNRIFRNPYFRKMADMRVTGLALKMVSGGPPVRKTTPISAGVITHSENMILSFIVDRQQLDEHSAKAFIDSFFAQIRQTAETV